MRVTKHITNESVTVTLSVHTNHIINKYELWSPSCFIYNFSIVFYQLQFYLKYFPMIL